MIIWIASYPKSGNTWLRSFLASVFYTEDANSNFKNLNNIKQYPLRSHFNGLINDFKDIDQIVKNWSLSQDLINQDKKVKFLKTHHVNCKINGFNFSNHKNTLGAIYIVRDPRNVITSIQYHWSKSIEDSQKFIFDDQKWIGVNWDDKRPDLVASDKKNTNFPTLIGSWKSHYNMWKQMQKNFLLIKYEDLIDNPIKEFSKIIRFIEKILKFKIDDKKIAKAVENNKFKKLKDQEIEDGFVESILDKNTKTKKNFFYLGPNNKWSKNLDIDIRKNIEKKFYHEMKELGYL
tara:strand:+ start:64 stop:933 length:870 start_codon:yes stop_codon:yes gene_type:complete